MKTFTKVIISLSVIAVWIVSMCVFVPKDLKTITLDGSLPNNYFSAENNYIVEDVFNKKFNDGNKILQYLQNAQYRCISEDVTYDILFQKGNELLNGYYVEDNVMSLFTYMDGKQVNSFAFFEFEEKSYVLFLLNEKEKDSMRILGFCYAIYETDDFDELLSEHFVTSQSIISKPASYAALESFIQSGITTLAYGIIVFVIYIIITTVIYRNKRKGRMLSDDETTTDGDIKKYIKDKLGHEFFDEEKVFSMPCLILEADGEKAKDFICLMAENLKVKEIFIGGFFEKKCFIDENSENSIFIKEYLDENSYSSINYIENEAVIEWIIDGNNKDETSISFYIQELNILIYPVKNKLYILSKNSREIYDKLISFINPTDYNLKF